MENKVLQKNLERIEQYDSKLAHKILMFNCEKSNISILKTKQDEYNLAYNSVLIHSNDGARDEAIRISNKIEKNNGALRIIYGLGLGYLPDEMANRDEKIIIYEPNLEILKFVLSIAKIDAIFKENVFVAADKDSLAAFVKKIANDDTKMTISFLPSYKNLFYDDIVDTLNCAQRAQGVIKAVKNTYLQNAPMALKNQFSNLKDILKNPSIGQIKDIYKDKTAIVLSAGPSLAENVEIIKNNKDKFVIFAVNVTLKLLSQHDIQPDFVCVVEPYCTPEQILNINPKESYFIFDTFIDPELHLIETKKKFNYVSRGNFLNPWIRKILNIKDEIDTHGTVSFMALEAAYLMGFKKIIVCGQDLAYKDGKCYSKGSQFEDLECVFDESLNKYVIKPKDFERYINSLSKESHDRETRILKAKYHLEFLNSNLYTIKSQTGKLIPTQTGYALFVDFFREFALKIKKEAPDVVLINSSTGGAQIDGFINRALSEVVLELEKVERINLDSVTAIIEKDSVISQIKLMEEKLKNELQFFKDLKELLRKILKEISIKKIITPACEKYLKKFREYIVKLSSSGKDFELNLVFQGAYYEISEILAKDFLSSKEVMDEALSKISNILDNEINKIEESYIPSLSRI